MTNEYNVLELTTKRLNELVILAENCLENTGVGSVVDKSAAEQAQYDIGKAMSEAKQLFQGNKNRFGQWRDEHIIGNGQYVVNKRSLTRWASLCNFGTIEACRKVGFTNVYKLSGKRYAPLREDITELLKGDPEVDPDAINVMFKDFSVQLKVENKKAKQGESDDLTNKVAELEARLHELEDENAALRQQLEPQHVFEAE